MSYAYVGRVTLATEREMEVGSWGQAATQVQRRNPGRAEKLQRRTRDRSAVDRGRCHGVEDRAGVEKTLEPSQRIFVRGYAVTSYASQGKTVDTV